MLAVIKKHLEEGRSIDEVNAANQSFLYTAVKECNIEQFKFLIQQNADINLSDRLGITPLILAITHQVLNPFIFETLINHEKVDLNLASHDGNTPLLWAILKGDLSIVEILLSKKVNINVSNNNGDGPLHLAAQSGNFNIVAMLINIYKVDVNLFNYDGNTALHFAAKYSYNYYDERIHLDLNLFTKLDYYNVTKILIENNIDLNKTNKNGETALHLSISISMIRKYKNLKVIEMIMNQTANINLADNNGDTPLHLAVRQGNIDVAQALINKQANVNLLNNKGNTPLHLAIQRGCLNTFIMLMKQVFGGLVKNHVNTSILLDISIAQNTEINLGIIAILIKNGITIKNIENINKDHNVNIMIALDNINKFMEESDIAKKVILSLLPAINNLENAFYLSEIFTKEDIDRMNTKIYDQNPDKLKIERLFFFLNKYKDYYNLENLRTITDRNSLLTVYNFLVKQLKQIFKSLISHYPEKAKFIAENFEKIAKNNNIFTIATWLKRLDYYVNYNQRIIDKLIQYVTLNQDDRPASIITSFLDLQAKSEFQKAILFKNNVDQPKLVARSSLRLTYSLNNPT